MFTTRVLAAVTLGLLLSLARPGEAVTLDFEDFDHGEGVTSSHGVLISTVNIGGGPNLSIAFDTMESGTRDPDLEFGGGWAGGNLPSNTVLGNLLVIQENSQGCYPLPGPCSYPDDEGSRPAGSITLDYRPIGTFSSIGFDLVDVENLVVEDGMVEFYLDGALVSAFGFSDFAGMQWGDNSANRVDGFDVGGEFDVVVFHLGGSGGIDNVQARRPGSGVPEPGSAALFVLGFGLIARSRRPGA